MDLCECPECGAVAEVTRRAVLESTDGPVEHAAVRCVRRHVFFLPVAMLAREAVLRAAGPPPAAARPAQTQP